MKYAVYTLGCKVNQFETQALEQMLQKRGFLPCTGSEPADVVVINTCAVTAESGRKSRQTVRRYRDLHPQAVLAVCGCLSQLEPDSIRELGADIVFGSGEKEKLAEALEQRLTEIRLDDPFRRIYFEELPAGAVSGRTRALLKIQDGCDHFCTYCIIPYTRGKVRSLPPEACRRQAVILEEQGYREIVITGIEIASYGKDLPGRPGLADAVQAVSDAAPHARIHLGSLEPTVITREFCSRLADMGNICSHFHLSLQSGSDTILRRMHRRYDTADFARRCELLREWFPSCSLTADVIFGFPGETEEDLRITLSFMEACRFFFVHAFPFSPRPGTPAADMPEQVPKNEKERRVRLAKEVITRLQNGYLASCVGKTFPVLFENEHTGHAENYCVVHTDAAFPKGSVRDILITKAEDGLLYGHGDVQIR